MSKKWLLFSVTLGLVLLVVVPAGRALAQDSVTFQVNMRIMMEEGKFLPGSGDIVTVRGSLNNWGNDANTDTLKDPNGDSVYAITKSLPTGGVTYKFWKTLRGGLDYENVDNRTYTVVGGTQTIPSIYFNNDDIYHAAPNVPVTFQVNMKVKLLEGGFKPNLGDILRVTGDFNGWPNMSSTDTLKDRGDSIYTHVDSVQEGSTIHYKFLKTLRGGSDWEGNQPTPSTNREFTAPTGGGLIPVTYFDNDSVVNVAISANILWQADMSAYETLGWFRPDLHDSLEVRGSFTGWGGTKMDQDQFVNTEYEVLLAYSGFSYDVQSYKFHMNLDSASAVTRFPGITFGTTNNLDDIQYDHTYDLGDGNRSFNVGNGGDLSSPSSYICSVHRYGLLLHSTDTVNVTLRVNMGPATRYLDPLVLADDTVRLVWHDLMWAFSQVKIQGSFPTVLNMTHSSATDSIFSVSFKVIGKAHYGMMYFYRFVHKNGTTSVNEGGGLGALYPDRVRFIQPLGPNSFPKSYTAPVDVWQFYAPMPGEVPPFGVTAVKEQPRLGTPSTYKLSQNYPNPFNPTTRITYSIPEKAMVTLKVYNVLGQQVGTLVNEQETAGHYVAQFEANNLPSGVYFYRLQAGKFSEVKKMLLMK